MVDESSEEGLFVGEVIVNERLAHSGVAGDVAEGERRRAGGRDSSRRGVQDPLGCAEIRVVGAQGLLLAAARPLEDHGQTYTVL
jgi:hypothetical protein